MAEGAQVRCVGKEAQIESLNLHGFYPDSLEGFNVPSFFPVNRKYRLQLPSSSNSR
jgi:hypothetical protein